MAVSYSQDLRDRVLAAYDQGMQTKQIATTFNVSPAWARRVKQRRRELDRTSALPRGGHRHSKIDLDRLRELVEQQPDATLIELRDRLGVTCHDGNISRALRRLNFTFKKRQSTRQNRIVPMSPNVDASGKRIREDDQRAD